MSVETGISPRELLALDADMFDAVLVANAERWTPERELLALAVEIADAHFVSFVRAHARKNAHVRDPISVPRPPRAEEERAKDARPVSVQALASLTGQDVTSVERGDGGR